MYETDLSKNAANYQALSPLSFLQRTAAIYPGRTAWIHGKYTVNYQEFGERQDQSRAEARTLRQLAGLQEDLMLTPEQRNDVYGVLHENSLAEIQGKSDISSLIESFASQAGVTIDPALQGVISGLANRGLEGLASGQALDRESIEEFATGAVTESVEQQVEQLRPVLTEDQLQLYRSQLEGRIGNLMRRGQARE